MKAHIGSYAGTTIGVLFILTGLSQIETKGAQTLDIQIMGAVILAGSFCYRSAKKRKRDEVSNSKLRVGLEILALLGAGFLIFGQNNYIQLAMINPIMAILTPAWVLIAYLIVNLINTKL